MVAGGAGGTECGKGGVRCGLNGGTGGTRTCTTTFFNNPGTGGTNTSGGNGNFPGKFGYAR